MIYTLVRKNDKGVIDAIVSFTSISSMDESWNSTVTSQPIEFGFNVTDNINIENPTYDITGTISSYSLFRGDKEIVWDGEDFTNKTESNPKFHIDVREQMIRVFSQRKTLTLIESSVMSDNANDKGYVDELKSGYFKEIENCVITSLSFSYPENSMGAINVNMKLQKLTIANTVIAELEEGEKRALLRPLAANYEPFSSSRKEEAGDIDPTTGLPEENPTESVQGNYEEMKKKESDRIGLTDTKSEQAARAISDEYIKQTGKLSTIMPVGDGWVAIEGKDQTNPKVIRMGGGSE